MRRLLVPTTLCAALCIAGAAQAQTKGPQPKIEAVAARLIYETTGVLSLDISTGAFTAFNTNIGSGDAKEPANDILVTVALSVPGDQANVDGPLVVKVTDGRNKVIAQRAIKGLFFNKGKLTKAVFVPDAACAGKMKIEVGIGSAKRTKTVEMNCGE